MNEINWTLLLIVFLARIVDVSLGTIRIIYIGKGMRVLAPLLGFIEVFIWIVVVSQLVTNVSNLPGYLAYAAGFAAGNFVGMAIENRLAIGTLMVRVIVAGETDTLIHTLQDSGYGVTYFNAQGSSGPVKVIYSVIKRKELKDIVMRIQDCDPDVFYTIEEVRQANKGVFHKAQSQKYAGLKGKR